MTSIATLFSFDGAQSVRYGAVCLDKALWRYSRENQLNIDSTVDFLIVPMLMNALIKTCRDASSARHWVIVLSHELEEHASYS